MTSTDLVEHATTTLVPNAANSLIEWAQAANAAHELAQVLGRSPFIPAHFAGKPGDATAAIIFGAEVGLSPLQALQGIYVIGGKPALYARSLMAITLAHGHQVWTEELTDARAIVCGRRRGTDNVERVVWTIDRAKKAGYTKNAKYGSDPQSMLLARAQSDVCRRVAADALLGMPYSVEELEDAQASDGTATTTEPKRTARRTSAPAPTPEAPPLDDPEPVDLGDAPDAPEDSDAEMITAAQLKKMGAAMGTIKMTDRAEALDFVSSLIGREITSRNDLAKDEASQVIDRLEALESVAADKAAGAE